MSGDEIVVAAHEAMATTFRIHIVDMPERYARQAAAAAFAEIDRLERLLSRYREGSDVHRINAAEAESTILVSSDTAHCLRTALEVAQLTEGAFDPALGALTGDPFSGGHPAAAPGDMAGVELLELDVNNRCVRKLASSLKLDLGAIGKGYAVDLAFELLADWDVTAAMIDSGGSTVLARDPARGQSRWTAHLDGAGSNAEIRLHDHALASSGCAVKGAHIVDRKTGQSHARPGRVWAWAQSAAVADALSTAFFVMPWNDVQAVCQRTPGIGAASIGEEQPDGASLLTCGSFPSPA